MADGAMEGKTVLEGEAILVTGAAGQVARPIVEALAPSNQVIAVDLFREDAVRTRLAACGASCLAKDLRSDSLRDLPEAPSYVMHFAAFADEGSQDFEAALAVNAVATGRLMAHCRGTRGFLHCSSTAIYRYKGHEPVSESDPLADRMAGPFPVYSISKIAGEAVARFASEQWSLPTTIARLNVPYGRTGGMPAMHLTCMLEGQPIVLHPDRPNQFNPVFEDDYVEQACRLLGVAQSPAVTVNWCGSERVGVEEYCTYMGELLDLEPRFEYSEQAMGSLVCDTSRLHALIGTTRVPWREGIRRLVEARPRDRRMAAYGS